jgi:hypothetical protein
MVFNYSYAICAKILSKNSWAPKIEQAKDKYIIQ